VASINDRALLAGSAALAQRAAPADPLTWVQPVKTDYRIGSQDLLEIEIYELEEPNKSKVLRARVTQEGYVVVPLIGPQLASGKTTSELQSLIETMLGRDFLVNPSVSVLVTEYQARKVRVLGAVTAPGTFTLKENSSTLLDVLSLAGGPTEKAGSAIFVVRSGAAEVGGMPAGAADGSPTEASASAAPAPVPGASRLVKIDLLDLVERGNLAANCVLEDGDIVHVPLAAQVFVMGQVNKGGAFPLRGEITVMKAIALAGGLKPDATPSATVLIRMQDGVRTTIPIDLTQLEAGSHEDLLLQADDVLVVSESGGDKVWNGIGSLFRTLFRVGWSVN
jgi:polysaccharide export outer membrane protein